MKQKVMISVSYHTLKMLPYYLLSKLLLVLERDFQMIFYASFQPRWAFNSPEFEVRKNSKMMNLQVSIYSLNHPLSFKKAEHVSHLKFLIKEQLHSLLCKVRGNTFKVLYAIRWLFSVFGCILFINLMSGFWASSP